GDHRREREYGCGDRHPGEERDPRAACRWRPRAAQSAQRRGNPRLYHPHLLCSNSIDRPAGRGPKRHGSATPMSTHADARHPGSSSYAPLARGERYDTTTIMLHWAIAILIVTLLGTGWYMVGVPKLTP